MSSSSQSFHAIPDFFSPLPPPNPCRPPLEHRQRHRRSPPFCQGLVPPTPLNPAFPSPSSSTVLLPPYTVHRPRSTTTLVCSWVTASCMFTPTTFPGHRHPPPPGPCHHRHCPVLLLGCTLTTRFPSSSSPMEAPLRCPFLQPPLIVAFRSSRPPPLAKHLSSLPLLANPDTALESVVLSQCRRPYKLRRQLAPSGRVISFRQSPPHQAILLLVLHPS